MQERTPFEQQLLALKVLPDCVLEVPQLKATLFKHQKTGVNYLLNIDTAMLGDELGCLSGKTKVKINRNGNCRTYTIKEAYFRINNTWRKDIVSKIQSEQKGYLYLNDVIDIIYQGKKPTIKLQTKTKSIIVTPDHLFLTPTGYQQAKNLHKNSIVLVNGLKYCPICKKYTEHSIRKYSKFYGKCKICIYRFYRNNHKKTKKGESLSKNGYVLITSNIRYYPYGRRESINSTISVAVNKHRLVLESKLNNLTYKQWLNIIKYNRFTKNHKFLPKKIHIHHRNGNVSDNRLCNLKIVSCSEHHLLHHKIANFGTFIPKKEKIIKISKAPSQDVYDIKMKEPYHNFVANGFIVHNCGKSLQSIGVSLLRKHKNEIKKCLIICPATTKYSVWKREIEKFTSEKCLVVDGSSKKRAEIYTTFFEREDIFYLIMNYEQLLQDNKYLLNFPRNSLCIADESIYIKSKDSKRTKELKKIPFKYKIAITGYPAANKILDIWSQFDWLKPGFLGSYWSFFDKYVETIIIKLHETEENKSSKGRKCKCCGKWSPEQKYAKIYTCCCINPEWEAPSFKKVVGYKNLNELKHKLEPYFIRRLKSEALDLPEKTYQEREVLLSGELLRAYIAMKEEMKVSITNMSNEEVIAKANGILTQMLRLSQLTCGFITDVKLNQPVFYKENPKVKALDDIIDEVITSGNKIVIWTRFRAFTAYIYKRYNEGFKYDGTDIKYNCAYFWGGMSSEEKDTNINRFQTDPNCKIIIGTVQTGGMGITLHSGNVAVFTDLSFLSPSTVIQAESRQHRIGQTKNVTIIRLLAKGTVDQHWMKVLEDKQTASRALFREDVEEDKSGVSLDKDTLLEMLE